MTDTEKKDPQDDPKVFETIRFFNVRTNATEDDAKLVVTAKDEDGVVYTFPENPIEVPVGKLAVRGAWDPANVGKTYTHLTIHWNRPGFDKTVTLHAGWGKEVFVTISVNNTVLAVATSDHPDTNESPVKGGAHE